MIGLVEVVCRPTIEVGFAHAGLAAHAVAEAADDAVGDVAELEALGLPRGQVDAPDAPAQRVSHVQAVRSVQHGVGAADERAGLGARSGDDHLHAALSRDASRSAAAIAVGSAPARRSTHDPSSAAINAVSCLPS